MACSGVLLISVPSVSPLVHKHFVMHVVVYRTKSVLELLDKNYHIYSSLNSIVSLYMFGNSLCCVYAYLCLSTK